MFFIVCLEFAQSVFLDNFVELPSSGTEKVRNLWLESNIEVPGMWVIELSQKQNDHSIHLSQLKCVGSISPERVIMQALFTKFTLSGFVCFDEVLDDATLKIEVIFTGTKKNLTVDGKLDPDSGTIKCKLQYWGKAEEVDITVKLNDVTQPSSSKVLFCNPGQMLNEIPMLHFYFLSDQQIEVHLRPLIPIVGTLYSDMTITFLFMGKDGKFN